jgi:phosphatidylserine/phosphatidylglycerophosphate/cardiolipin synthase-like enzyme
MHEKNPELLLDILLFLPGLLYLPQRMHRKIFVYAQAISICSN